MRKIEINNHQSEVFYNLINGSESGYAYLKPIDQLKKIRKNNYNNCNQFEYHFLTCIIRYYKKIVLMKPKSMQLWIKRIDYCFKDKFYKYEENSDGKMVFTQTKFAKDLTKALDYEKLQKKVLKKFFHRFQTNTCYYCNSQYTLTFKKDKLESVKFQIDHIFPKKKYPYFSISLYNLVPSCANCNLNKGDKDFWIENYCHPYLESIGDRFKFSLSRESDKTLYNNSTEVNFEDISISITNLSDKKVSNHNDLFDIEGIYSNFSDIVREIIALGYVYPESKRNELLNSYKDKNGMSIFKNKESIDRIFLRIYPDVPNTNTRPLSKYIQDIARFSDFYDDKI
jgi:5-methylcytosine-specific restriction endonuclease McrA